ncbi:MAG: DUF1015 domain-containing protein, partial [Clostridia bacterium]|nr:DUF1015 domain-containing protein [Clostridia bacterium]
MAYIVPVKGLRYKNTQELALLTTPPYDVISSQEQDAYYQKHPYNIIRLEYGKIFPEDTEENNRYTRAAQDFAAWKEQGVLQAEAEPSIYIYAQEFSLGKERKTRTGLMAGVRIEPYETGSILPHEETLPKHKADRLALMKACQANFSPIFSLYSDSQMQVEKATEAALQQEPVLDFVSEDGQRHRLWAVSDLAVIKQVQAVLQDKTFFIADGHHRYETAMNYRNWRHESDPAAQGEQAYDFVMMNIVNLYNPGLVVLPTHRLVNNLPTDRVQGLLAKLQGYFQVQEFGLTAASGQLDPLKFEGFLAKLAGISGKAFGFYAGGETGYLLNLQTGADITSFMPVQHSSDWKNLDVSLLHSLIMESFLGIGGLQRAEESNLTYTREELQAAQRVQAGEYQMVFFMNPTRVEEVTAVAANGEKMPQ